MLLEQNVFPVLFGGNHDLTIRGSGTTNILGAINTGTGGLIKDGTGTVRLAAANSFTGATTVNAGVLELLDSAALSRTAPLTINGAGKVLAKAATTVANLAGAGILELDGVTLTTGSDGRDSTFSGAIIGSGGLTKAGAGRLTLTGANSYSGLTTISAGTLQIGNGGNTGTLGSGDVINNGTLVFNRSGAVSVGGAISGTGGLIKEGSGTLTLSGASSYAGQTLINAGTVVAANSTALGSTEGNTIVAAGATLALTTPTAISVSEAITLNGSGVGGRGALRTEDGFVTLAGPITLGSAVRIEADTFTRITGTITGDHDLTIGGDGFVDWQGAINTGAGGLIKDGVSTVELLAANGFTGAATVNEGALVVRNGAALSDTARLTINDPGRVTFATAATIGSLAGSGLLELLGTTLTLGGDGSDTTFSGAIVGSAGGLTKQGSGTLTLTGRNTYTGLTTIAAGAIVAGASQALGTGGVRLGGTGSKLVTAFDGTLANALRVMAGADATLAVATGNTTTLGGAITIEADTTLRLGTASEQGTLILGTSAVSVGNNARILLEGGNFRIADSVIQSALGNLNLLGSGLALTPDSTFDLAGANVALGAISGNGTITNSGGASTLTLTGSTFGGTFDTGLGSITLLGSITGASGLIKRGDGILIFGPGFDTSEFTGGLTLTRGTLSLQGNLASTFGTIRTTGSVIDYGNGITTNAAAIAINSNTTQLRVLDGSATQSGVISELGGARGFEKIGAGTLTLTGANTFTGVTTVSAGTLTVANDLALGTTAGNTVIADGATLALDASVVLDEAIILNGSGLAGAGALRNLGGFNQLDGAITLASAARINSDSGLLTIAGGISGAGHDLTFGGTAFTTILSPVTLGAGRIVKDGTSLLSLFSSNAAISELIINGGTVQIGFDGGPVNSALADTAGVTITNGALIVGASETIGSLAGAASAVVTDQGRVTTLTVGTDNASTLFAGTLGDTLGLTKVGTGTLTLTGANTHMGATRIEGGTLALGVNEAISNSSWVQVAGGTLALGSFSDTVAGVSLSAGSITGGPGSALVSNSNYLQSGGTLEAGATVNVQSGGVITLSGGTIAGTLNSARAVIPAGILDGGSVLVTGSIGMVGDLIIGNSGMGVLTISGGGVVQTRNGIIGALAGSSGEVLITGTGSQWNSVGFIDVGDQGRGKLTITDGGRVSTRVLSFIGGAIGSTGEVLVTGAGSRWTSTNGFRVGEAGRGQLTITNGGEVSGVSSTIGSEATSANSTVLVSGAGSRWTNSSIMVVGGSGSGALTIENGGVVSNTASQIGQQASATGTVTVTGAGSQWINNGNLQIGGLGEGTITIADGGLVRNTVAQIGFLAGSQGTATVSGAGSRWESSENLIVGSTGNGTLAIENGGVVTNAASGIGLFAGSTGTVTLTGAGSRWENASLAIIGAAGNGSVTIADGGYASSRTSLFVGTNPGSRGDVLITGAGSRWDHEGVANIGRAAAGTLTLAEGGVLSAQSVEIGFFADAAGTLIFGAAEGSAPVAAGSLITPTIAFGAGTGTIVFNHSATDFELAAAISGNGALHQLAGRFWAAR